MTEAEWQEVRDDVNYWAKVREDYNIVSESSEEDEDCACWYEKADRDYEQQKELSL